MEKYEIEKDSIQKILIIPLYGGGFAHTGFLTFIRIQRRQC